MSFKRSIFSLGALVVAFAAAPSAQAQSCITSAQCHKGFICVTTPVNMGTPTPQPAPADPTAPAKISALVAPSTGYCQEAPCASDSECGAGMVCHTETISGCSGGTAPACAPDAADCGAKIAPPTCTETKVSTCMFTWQLPCSTDTQCGAGFKCNPTVTGTCSGGSGVATPGTTGTGSAGTAGTNTSGGGSAPSTGASPPADIAVPVVPPDNCTTTTSFPGWCAPKADTCASNTDCPTDWTCTAVATGGVSSSGTGAAGTSGSTRAPSAGAPASDAALLPAPGPSAPPTMICTSPYGTGYGAPKTAQDSGVGGNPTSGGTGAAGTRGTGNTGGGAAGTGGGTIPPSSPSPTHESATPGATPSAGCAVAGGGSSAAFVALALLGLAIARRRK